MAKQLSWRHPDYDWQATAGQILENVPPVDDSKPRPYIYECHRILSRYAGAFEATFGGDDGGGWNVWGNVRKLFDRLQEYERTIWRWDDERRAQAKDKS